MSTPAESAALLQLLWLASPALPVGGYSYSEGLEAAIDAGVVSDETSAAAWLLSQLQLAQARSELPLAASAWRAWHDLCGLCDLRSVRDANDGQAADCAAPAAVQALNDWVLHTRESHEMRRQTEQMGRSLADWLRQRTADDPVPDPRCAMLSALAPAPTWPLAFALAAERAGASDRNALLALAFGWAENLVQAAVKAIPLGQSAGQRVLGALTAAIPAAVDDALARSASDADADAARARGKAADIDDGAGADAIAHGHGAALGAGAGDEAVTACGRQAFTPMLAILSAQHEAQYSRLFRS